MAGEEIGGFFASLKLATDNASFRQGMSAVSGLAGSLKGLLEGGAIFAGIAESMKAIYDAANKQGQLFLTGDYLGMSADAVTAWGGAINEAGGNAEGFVSSVKEMHRSLVQLYAQGKTNDQMFLNLGLLLKGSGKTIDQFMKESTNQQVKDIMTAGARYPDKQKGYEYILSLLGPDALKAVQFARTNRHGDVMQMYSDALSRVFTPGADTTRKGALEGTAQVRNLFENMGGIWEGFSALAMSDAAPKIKEINDWFKANHANILKGINVAVGVFEMLMDLTNFGLAKGALKGFSEWKRPDAPITSGRWWMQEAGNVGNVASEAFKPFVADLERMLSRINIKVDISDEAKKLLKVGVNAAHSAGEALGIVNQKP